MRAHLNSDGDAMRQALRLRAHALAEARQGMAAASEPGAAC